MLQEIGDVMMKIVKIGAIWCPGCLVMKKVWNSQRVPENLVTKLYDLHHFCNKEIQKDLLKFFDEKLK